MRTTGRKKFGAFSRIFVTLLLLPALLAAEMLPAAALTWADIDDLKSDAEALAGQKKELQSKLDSLADDKSRALERKRLLDQQIANTGAQIQNVEAQIGDYEVLIAQTEAELLDAQQRERVQYELFCRRVREMEERGTVSYWAVLFKAASFTDLLSRLDIINEIMDSDQRVISGLQALQAEIEEKKTELEAGKTASQAARAELVEKKAELSAQRTAADKLVQEIQGNEAAYAATLDEIDQEEEYIQKRIVQLSRELAIQEAAQGKPSNAAAGGYIWPVGSRRITSPMGSRYTGIPGASTNHKGVDIGGVGYTSEIHAAKAGTVIVSQYSNSYGNYVVVSHGSGNTTLYAHMSSRKVAEGDDVDQGDVLGITGSTGISNGPHLHFEITENGERVDPLIYLTGYIQAW